MRRLIVLFTVLAVLAAAGAALAATSVDPASVYVGKSTQGIPVRLAAAIKGNRWFRYRAKMTCNDGSSYLDDFFSDDVAIRHNHFASSYTSSAGAITTKVTGTLTGARASGTVRITERFSEIAVNGVTPLAADGSIICDSKTVHWNAQA